MAVLVLLACPGLPAPEAAFPTCSCNGSGEIQTRMDGGGPYLRCHHMPCRRVLLDQCDNKSFQRSGHKASPVGRGEMPVVDQTIHQHPLPDRTVKTLQKQGRPEKNSTKMNYSAPM